MTADTRNKDHENTPIELSVEQIAYSVQVTRAALDHGSDELPYEISERLRAIRVRALAQAKQSVKQPEQEKADAVVELFNWRHKLTGWFKAGVAVSAFALALMISVVSIRSELTTDVAVSDRAISMAEPSSTSIASQQASAQTAEPNGANQAVVSSASPESAHTLVGSANTAKRHTRTAPQQYAHDASAKESSASSVSAISTADLAYQAHAPALAGTNPASSVASASFDDEIGLVLHEQIPLQAYLNDDFARFANHQGLSTIEKLSNTNSSTNPEQ